MKQVLSVFICLLFFSSIGFSQNVGIGTRTPHSSAALEISDSTKGILIPRMTMAQRSAIQNPAEGLMVYQTDSTKGFWAFIENTWKYLVNTETNFNTLVPLIATNGSIATISNIDIPNFLNYLGNGTYGDSILTNNSLIQNFSEFKNLTINSGTTVKINPAKTTVIYIKDTLFLHGTINGSGGNANSFEANGNTNHLGATASGIELRDPPSNSYSVGSGGATLSYSWNVSQQPTTSYSFGGSLIKNPGYSNPYSGNSSPCTSGNGENLTTKELLQIFHFGLDISGGNGLAVGSCGNVAGGGEGGGGLYIVARCLIFDGTIQLNGGNGGYLSPCGYFATAGGAGGGSCVIRTLKLISNSGNFISTGGYQTAPYSCNKKGGDGAMLIIK